MKGCVISTGYLYCFYDCRSEKKKNITQSISCACCNYYIKYGCVVRPDILSIKTNINKTPRKYNFLGVLFIEN
jgi:hypothetical protein